MSEQTRPRWTEEQTRTLLNLYTTRSMADIGRMVGKSATCVAGKAKRMGLGSVQEHAAAEARGVTCSTMAKRLGVSSTTLMKWARRGCPHHRAGARGHLVFRWPEVMRWLAGQPFIFANLSMRTRESMGVDFDEIPVSPREARLRLGVPHVTLWTWQQSGCPTVDVGAATRCYIIRDVMRWVLDNPRVGLRMSSAYVRDWQRRLHREAAA